MSLNRINCDSRCTCFPVELEQQQIAIALRLMNKSLPTTPRPSPDRERCVIPDLNRNFMDEEPEAFSHRDLTWSDEISVAAAFYGRPQPRYNFHLNWLSQWEELGTAQRGRSSSVRLSLRRPHYRRQFWIALRLAALRPALSLRYALIGESIWKERSQITLPAGAGSNHSANIRSYSKQPLCQPLCRTDNVRVLKKLTQNSRFFSADDDPIFQPN